MTDFKDYISKMISQVPNTKGLEMTDIVAFFVDNGWFGKSPVFNDGKVLLSQEQVEAFTPPLQIFLSEDMHSSVLLRKLSNWFPLTVEQFEQFINEEALPEDVRFYLTDFLLYRLEKDLVLYTDTDISRLLQYATIDLTKSHGDYLTFFISWLRNTVKTAYFRDFVMDKRYTMDIHNEAYDFNEYLELLYYLFNEDYIVDNDMYQKASESKNFTDTWLYLSIHFICALRYTDLKRIYHPDLPYPPELILQKIGDGSFTDNDARMVLLSITQRMCLLPFTPNKTDSASGIGTVKFHIPSSCESHFGKLFALAEAHRQLDGTADSPIIKKVSTYSEISRYMGDEIGELFLTSDFRSRSATKSYLQSIYMLADDILDENGGPNVKGYILAAIARSHKGSYGEFASTTFEYLKDAKFSGLTPEFVAFELFERGVLSSIPSMLLKIVTDEEYSSLNVQKQTALIKALDLSPREVEGIVSVVDKGRRQAELVVKEVISSGTDIMAALHNIGSGQAFSKQAECLCLLSALNKLCPYAAKRQCVGCKYEICTKSTLFLLISEFNRLSSLYDSTPGELEREKYKQLITTVVLPKIDEMLFCIKRDYGEEVFHQYEQLIKENIE